jgi:hypothetical protein
MRQPRFGVLGIVDALNRCRGAHGAFLVPRGSVAWASAVPREPRRQNPQRVLLDNDRRCWPGAGIEGPPGRCRASSPQSTQQSRPPWRLTVSRPVLEIAALNGTDHCSESHLRRIGPPPKPSSSLPGGLSYRAIHAGAVRYADPVLIEPPPVWPLVTRRRLCRSGRAGALCLLRGGVSQRVAGAVQSRCRSGDGLGRNNSLRASPLTPAPIPSGARGFAIPSRGGVGGMRHDGRVLSLRRDTGVVPG